MSGTSHLNGRVRFSAAELLAGEEPVDTRFARDAMIGSGNIVADAKAQCRCNWIAARSSISAASNDIRVCQTRRIHDTLDTGEWYGLMPRHIGPLHIRANGTAHRLRVYAYGYSDGGDSVDFALSVVVRGVPHMTVHGGPLVGFALKEWTGITATTTALLSPDDGDPWVDLSLSQVYSSLRTFSTRVDLGGDRTTVTMPEFELRMMGRTSSASSEPTLTGLHISEFVG